MIVLYFIIGKRGTWTVFDEQEFAEISDMTNQNVGTIFSRSESVWIVPGTVEL